MFPYHVKSLTPMLQSQESQQPTTQSSTCKKVLRVIGIIILTLLTLGLFLVWKYCCSATPVDREEEVLGLPSSPSSPSSPVAPSTRAPRTPPPSPKPVRYVETARTMKQHDVPKDSPEYLFLLQQRGLQHPVCCPQTALGELNRGFLCTYPQSVYQSQQHDFQSFEEKIIAATTWDNTEEALSASYCLSQLQYLEQNYFIVQVPGDHSCFFRAYTVSWLCALMREKLDGNPQAIEQAIQKLQNLAIIESIPGGKTLTQKVVDILVLCDQFGSLQTMYDLVILDPKHVSTLITYLRTITFHAADEQKLQCFGEEGYRSFLLDQVLGEPKLFENAIFRCLEQQCRTQLSQDLQTTSGRTHTDWWSFIEPFLYFPVNNHIYHSHQIDVLYRSLYKLMISLPMTEEQLDLLRETLQECGLESAQSFAGEEFRKFKTQLYKCHKIPDVPSPLAKALTILLFFFQSPNIYGPRLQELSSRIYSLLVPCVQEHLRTHLNFPAGGLATSCLRMLCWELPSSYQHEDLLLEKLFLFVLQEPEAITAFPDVLTPAFLKNLYTFDANVIGSLSSLISAELPEEWETHQRLFKHLATTLSLPVVNTSKHGPAAQLISFLLKHRKDLPSWVDSKRISPHCEQQMNHFLMVLEARCAKRVAALKDEQRGNLLEQFDKLEEGLTNLRAALAEHMQQHSTAMTQHLNTFIQEAPLEVLSAFSRSMYYQAEDEHVTALASLLQNLSLCQSFHDGDIQHDLNRLSELSMTQGFLTLDFLPEDQGQVHVFRQHNHYSALIPKTKGIDLD